MVIVGRPNAGKSTLFNRLAGWPKALVDRTPGLTRDLNRERVSWRGKSFELVDTGGLAPAAPQPVGVDKEVLEQCLAALAQADAVICLFDGSAGWSPADAETVNLLRQARAQVIWAVNKIDCPAHEARAADFYRCGAESLVTISAEHGRGIEELIDRVLDTIIAGPEEAVPARPVSITIVGRPNVGKSSLLNRLLGTKRAIVDGQAGTTRDALDTPFAWGGKPYVLVDTAGIRRRPRIRSDLERTFVKKALESLERCEVALLVMDATTGIASQDVRLCALALGRGKGVVAVINKCDLLEAAERGRGGLLGERYPSLESVPVLRVSALAGTGVDQIMPVVERVAASHAIEMETRALNRVLFECTRAYEPPARRGRGTKLFYAVQVGRRPPHVVVFCNCPDAIDAAYTRYLERRLGQAFGLVGTSVRLSFRRRR